jgi:hypothetical protein
MYQRDDKRPLDFQKRRLICGRYLEGTPATGRSRAGPRRPETPTAGTETVMDNTLKLLVELAESWTTTITTEADGSATVTIVSRPGMHSSRTTSGDATATLTSGRR